jgi:hypothetical protein
MLGSLPFAPKPRIKWNAEKQMWSCLSGSPLKGAYALTPAEAYMGWRLQQFGRVVAA